MTRRAPDDLLAPRRRRRAVGAARTAHGLPTLAACSLMALLFVAPPSAAAREGAGQQRGLALARQARTALLDGRTAEAEKLMDQARIEWPDSPLLAALSGDVMVAAEAWSRALADYGEAATAEDPALTRHALFNRAVAASTSAEADLADAGVPLDPAALPEQGSPPGLIPALEAGIPRLRRARDDFLAANDLDPDDAARRSVAALNRRLDDLQQMLDELRQREEEGDEQGDEGEQGDQQGDESQDGDPQQGDQGDQGEGQEDQPQDPQQQPGEEGEDEGGEEGDDAEDQPQDGPQDEAPPEQAPTDLKDLTPEEMQRLIEALEDLERRARELQKARQARSRQSPEKDW